MEHARGAVQAQQASGTEKELHAVGDAQSSAVVWHQAATQRCAEASDWTGLAAATAALLAVTGGKGKSGRGGKNGGKGENGGKGAAFTGECYHCGETGHRKMQCPKLDKEFADKGKGRKGKGDKGKGKGGKALDYAGVDAGTGEQAEAAPTSEEERWWLGAQYSLVREVPDQPTVPPLPALPGSRPRRPVPTSNSFIALAEIDDSTAWPLPSRPGDTRCGNPCCAARSSRLTASSGTKPRNSLTPTSTLGKGATEAQRAHDVEPHHISMANVAPRSTLGMGTTETQCVHDVAFQNLCKADVAPTST